jgi:hypothetical protein
VSLEDRGPRIADRLPELIDALFQVALGIWIEEVDKEGERRVYQCPPDFRAAMYLVNRVMGLPAKEDEAERYQAIVDEVSRRVVEALSDVTPEIRESVVAQLKNR